MKEEGKLDGSDDGFFAIIEIGFDEAVISLRPPKATVILRGIYALSCHPVPNHPFQMLPAYGQLQKRFALFPSSFAVMDAPRNIPPRRQTSPIGHYWIVQPLT